MRPNGSQQRRSHSRGRIDLFPRDDNSVYENEFAKIMMGQGDRAEVGMQKGLNRERPLN